MMGDWNARIGKWKISKDGEAMEGRSSVDNVTNGEGKKLVEFCEEIGGIIKNGDTKGDWEGKETYIGGENSSVLDLVIEIENEEGSAIEELKIGIRIESDHLPVEINLEGEEDIEKDKRGKKEKSVELKPLWAKEREEEYRRRMEEKKIDEEEEDGVQKSWERLIKNIWEVGREMNLVKKQDGGGEWKERDQDIIAQKRNMWDALKVWIKYRREEDRIELRKERKRLKEIIKEKKKEKSREQQEYGGILGSCRRIQT